MALVFQYTPPKVDGAALVAAGKLAAEIAGAELLLEKATPLVPLGLGEKDPDTGEVTHMRDSGKVEHGPDGVKVTFTRTGADGYNVAARQHEDETLNHPRGGEAKFLAKPMHSEQAAVLAAMATSLREAIG